MKAASSHFRSVLLSFDRHVSDTSLPIIHSQKFLYILELTMDTELSETCLQSQKFSPCFEMFNLIPVLLLQTSFSR